MRRLARGATAVTSTPYHPRRPPANRRPISGDPSMCAAYRRAAPLVLCLAGLLTAGAAAASLVSPDGTDHDQPGGSSMVRLSVPWGHTGQSLRAESAAMLPTPGSVVPTTHWSSGGSRHRDDKDFSGQGHSHAHDHDTPLDDVSSEFCRRHGCGDDQAPPKPTPLPGAVWLFPSALVALRLIGRRAG
jgi:hypothetical protein